MCDNEGIIGTKLRYLWEKGSAKIMQSIKLMKY